MRISGVTTMVMGAGFSGVLCCSVKRSLVLCQDLAGSWYAQRERGSAKATVKWVQWFGDLDEGVSPN